MVRKIACGPPKLTLRGRAGPANFEATVIPLLSPINEIRRSGPLENCEGPQKCDIKGPNHPWQFLLILTPDSKEPYYCTRISPTQLVIDLWINQWKYFYTFSVVVHSSQLKKKTLIF